jgi:hypothetical protein
MEGNIILAQCEPVLLMDLLQCSYQGAQDNLERKLQRKRTLKQTQKIQKNLLHKNKDRKEYDHIMNSFLMDCLIRFGEVKLNVKELPLQLQKEEDSVN